MTVGPPREGSRPPPRSPGTRAEPARERAAAQEPADGRAATARRRPPVLGFVGFVATWSLAWWLPVGLLVRPVVPGGALTVLGLAALSLVPLGPLTRAFIGRRYPSTATRLLVFRPFWYVQLLMPLAAGPAVAGVVLGAPFGMAGAAGRWALAGATAALAVLAVAGYAGSRRLVVRSLELSFPALPSGLDGLRIVQISDLHVGPQTSKRFLSRVADRVTAAEPDLIAVTGDQVDDFHHDIRHDADAFGGLRAPLGVYAVAGNHDVYAGWPEVREGLERMGTRVLVNESVPIERDGGVLWLAGTGDPAAGPARLAGPERPAPDVERTLEAVPDGAFVVALAHNPALWPTLVKRGVQLTLSGHTHWGQIAIPRLRWSVVSPFVRYVLGEYRKGNQILWINPGTNYWGIPLRVGAPPEVTVVTLRRGR